MIDAVKIKRAPAYETTSLFLNMHIANVPLLQLEENTNEGLRLDDYFIRLSAFTL